MTASQAEAELARIERIFPLLPEVPEIYAEWRRLVVTHEVMGIQVHDARLVAAMRVHGISHILTFNTQDFRRYADITVVHPAEVAP
jgi:predicted nucleic acid-binding protein